MEIVVQKIDLQILEILDRWSLFIQFLTKYTYLRKLFYNFYFLATLRSMSSLRSKLAIAISVNPHNTLSFVIIINSLVHTVQAVSGITDDRILVYTRV